MSEQLLYKGEPVIEHGGTDRGLKPCKCVVCGRISICTEFNDYYTRPSHPAGPLFCESCVRLPLKSTEHLMNG